MTREEMETIQFENKLRVYENPLSLKDIDDQTPEICLAAVKLNCNAFIYVKEQNEDICLEAVMRNGYLLATCKRTNT